MNGPRKTIAPIRSKKEDGLPKYIDARVIFTWHSVALSVQYALAMALATQSSALSES